MPQTTPPRVTQGEFVSVKEHLETRIDAVEKTIRAAYPSRDELLDLLDGINHRITQLEISKAQLEGKADQTQVIIFGAIAIISFVITLIDWFVGQ